MNILVIPSWLHTKENPTMGSFFVEQAEALAALGNNVYIVFSYSYSIFRVKDFLKNNEMKIYHKNGVTYYTSKRLHFLSYKHYIDGCDSFVKGVHKLYENILEQGIKIDIIHAHSCFWGAVAALNLKKVYGLPYVITEHTTGLLMNRESLKGHVFRRVSKSLASAEKVVCVGNGLKKAVEDIFKIKNVQVVGNIVDTDFFSPEEKKEKQKEFILFSLAYLNTPFQVEKKGMDVLLKAYASFVKKSSVSVKLLIGGGGKEVETLRRMCTELNIEDKVIFLGALTRTEVAKYMRFCNAFILPSRYETFGVVYIEAMSCGKPVIATRNGGAEDFVNKTNGIMCNVDDVEGLECAINDMIENYGDYNKTYIRQNVIENYSKKAIGVKIDSLLKESMEVLREG